MTSVIRHLRILYMNLACTYHYSTIQCGLVKHNVVFTLHSLGWNCISSCSLVLYVSLFNNYYLQPYIDTRFSPVACYAVGRRNLAAENLFGRSSSLSYGCISDPMRSAECNHRLRDISDACISPFSKVSIVIQ